MPDTTTETFIWDRDYRNLAQVFPFLPAYIARLRELEAAGQYPYNASFNDHIPGIDPPRSNGESTGVFLLQRLRDIEDDAHRVNAAWDAGYRPLDKSTLSGNPVRVAGLVEFGWYVGDTGFRLSENVRLCLHHNDVAVLAPRARTRGRFASGQMLVLR